MKIGFLTSCLRDVELPELLQWAGDNGFGAVEIQAGLREASDKPWVGGIINPQAFTEEAAREISRAAKDGGVVLSCLTYCTNMLDPNPDVRRSRLDDLLAVIKAAALLDVDVVSCFAGRNPEKSVADSLDDFKEVFEKVMSSAADHGVHIALENCPMVNSPVEGLAGNIAYAPPLWRMIFETFPQMGLNYDPSHLVWMGVDHLKPVEEFARHIFHAHAKDTEIFENVLADRGFLPPARPRWWRYRLPGLGVIDWPKFLSALLENGYDGAVSIEHEDPVFSGDADRVKRGLNLARRQLEQAAG